MKAKKKYSITEEDYINAVKKADREYEIAEYGKQIGFCSHKVHNTKKNYDRNKMKRITFDY